MTAKEHIVTTLDLIDALGATTAIPKAIAQNRGGNPVVNVCGRTNIPTIELWRLEDDRNPSIAIKFYLF